MIVVNLFAGPGAGKSTTAALLFGELKSRGVVAELVTEFAKDLTWDESHVELSDQIYVFANQLHRLKRLRNKVQIVIVDSPLLLSFMYGDESRDINSPFGQLIMENFNKFDNINFFIKRVKEYSPIGRSQTIFEANHLDVAIHDLLNNLEISHTNVPGDREGVRLILTMLGFV